MASISTNLPKITDHIRVLQGEADNILEAALRDTSAAVKNHVVANWPIATGTSLAGWRVDQLDQLTFALVNPVDYTSWVWIHPNQGGPPPLWEKLVTEAVDAVNADFTDFVSDRVLALIER